MNAPDLAKVTKERDDWKDVATMQEQILTASARMEQHLRETLEWARQTIHHAHHEEPMDACRMPTCDAIRQALAKRRI